MAHSYWPLFDIRIRSPRVELRLPTDEEIEGLIEAARKGVHDPDFMPFTVAWTDRTSPEFERSTAQWHWIRRGNWDPANWNFGLATFVDGEPVGAQDIMAQHFATLKTVSSGSWLTRRLQGQGLGKEMRNAMLHFAFEGLGAEFAESGARVENTASIGVSTSIGYQRNGLERRQHPRGEGFVEVVKFRLSRDRWLASERPPVTIEGLESCLAMFGADSPASKPSPQGEIS